MIFPNEKQMSIDLLPETCFAHNFQTQDFVTCMDKSPEEKIALLIRQSSTR